MRNIEKRIVLEPDTFLWKKGDQGLFYNSASHQSYLFTATNLISLCCDKILDINNLYSIAVPSDDLEDEALSGWIHEVVSRKLGVLMERLEEDPYIISFPPLLNLQSDVDRIEAEEGRNIGEFAAQNWNEFSIYLGGESECPDLHKQVPYPVNDSGVLNFYDLQAFFASADNSYLNTINVIGDIFSYPYRQELMDLLYSIPVKKNFYMTASCVCWSLEQIEQFDFPDYQLFVFYEAGEEVETIYSTFTEKSILFRWVYLISSEKQYEELAWLEDRYGKESIEVHPIYSGDNLKFFEDNVYMEQEEILHSFYDKKDIFAHQVMNTNFWGRLAVLPGGDVYSNLHQPPIGTLKDSVYELVVNEMQSHRSWRWTRDEISPCKDCLFRYLCPSPSKYELAIGKTNLCYATSCSLALEDA